MSKIKYELIDALSCKNDNDLTEQEIKQLNNDIQFLALELCKITTNDAFYNKNTMNKLKLIRDITTIYKNPDKFEQLIRSIETHSNEDTEKLNITFREFLERSAEKLNKNNFLKNEMKIQRRNYMAYSESDSFDLAECTDLDEDP